MQATLRMSGRCQSVAVPARLSAAPERAPSGCRALALAAAAAAGAAAGGLPARGAPPRSGSGGAPQATGIVAFMAFWMSLSSPISSGAQKATALPSAPRGRCGRCGGRSFRPRWAGRSYRRAGCPECRARGRRHRWRRGRGRGPSGDQRWRGRAGPGFCCRGWRRRRNRRPQAVCSAFRSRVWCGRRRGPVRRGALSRSSIRRSVLARWATKWTDWTILATA